MKKLMSKIVVILALLISASGQIFSGAQENAAKHTLKEMTVVERCKAKVGVCAQSIKSLVWGNNGWKEHYIRRSLAAVVATVSGMYGMYAFAGEGIVLRAENLGRQREEVSLDPFSRELGSDSGDDDEKEDSDVVMRRRISAKREEERSREEFTELVERVKRLSILTNQEIVKAVSEHKTFSEKLVALKQAVVDRKGAAARRLRDTNYAARRRRRGFWGERI